MLRAAMNVAAGEGEPGAHRELMGHARRTAQDNLRGKNVAGEAGQGGNLYPEEFAKSAADVEMMRSDMERYIFHSRPDDRPWARNGYDY